MPTLTRRERDVLRLLIDGRTNVEITKLLGIRAQTVKDHVSALFRKVRGAQPCVARRDSRSVGIL